MRDVRRASALLNNRFPLDTVLRVLHELVDAVQAESPHVVHGADLDITTAMNIDAKIKRKIGVMKMMAECYLLVINNETAMVGSSLRQVAL